MHLRASQTWSPASRVLPDGSLLLPEMKDTASVSSCSGTRRSRRPTGETNTVGDSYWAVGSGMGVCPKASLTWEQENHTELRWDTFPEHPRHRRDVRDAGTDHLLKRPSAPAAPCPVCRPGSGASPLCVTNTESVETHVELTRASCPSGLPSQCLILRISKGAGLGGGELQASPGGGASFLTLVPALTALPLRGSCSVHRTNPPLASFTLNLKSLQTRLVISGTK